VICVTTLEDMGGRAFHDKEKPLPSVDEHLPTGIS
jgi:hypothetical protein